MLDKDSSNMCTVVNMFFSSNNSLLDNAGNWASV